MNNESKTSKQWLIPLIIIPLVLILLAVYVVLNYANGRPLFALPIDQTATVESNDDDDERLKIANAEIKKLRTKLADQTNILKAKEQEVVRLIAERDRLKKTPAVSAAPVAEETVEEKKQATVTDVYSEMAPKQAALILNELSPTEVVTILEDVDAETQAEIIGKMDPKKAAALTQLIAN